MKPFRIVATVATYSKKKGSFRQNITIEKNIPTLEEAQKLVIKFYPKAIQISSTIYKTPGMLESGKVEIKNF
jgi:hypothetical protein